MAVTILQMRIRIVNLRDITRPSKMMNSGFKPRIVRLKYVLNQFVFLFIYTLNTVLDSLVFLQFLF